jgi:hypothetical protein
MARRVTEPRKKLTAVQKLQIMVRQARCPLCNEKLGELTDTEFDHAQALVNGGADDLENFQAVHADCHDKKTNGPGGERRVTTAGSDRHIADKTDRLSEQHKALRSRMLAPEERQTPQLSRLQGRGFAPPQRRGRASAPLSKICNPPFNR